MNRLRAYAQLVRLPNLPTAFADICLGALATGSLGVPARLPAFLLLLLASGCLYCGGMVWNDFFDVDQDTRERPSRPIPSGRVSRRQAGRFGAALVAAGVVFAVLAGLASAWAGQAPAALSPTLAAALAAAVFLYDAWLKRSPLGPVGMGLCRFLNVMLGVSVAGDLVWTRGAYLGLVVGLYVAGVTWLARTEARVSSRPQLAGAAALMLVALMLALPLPALPLPRTPPPDAASVLFPYLLVALGFAVGFPVAAAVREPTPERVQAAVKRSLMCLIVLDAVLASALGGTLGLIILVLLAPSLYLNRKKWLYAT
jgi:4-hydroxybenzoate polyprenyltransferase